MEISTEHLKHIISGYTDISELNEDEIQAVFDIMTVEKFEKKTIISKPGNTNARFFFIFEGVLRSYFLDEQGKEITYHLMGPNEIYSIWESAYINRPSDHYLEAVTDAYVLTGNTNEVKRLSQLILPIHRVYSRLVPVIIGSYLYELQMRYSKSPAERYKILTTMDKKSYLPHLPHKIVASYFAIAPESYSRMLKRLKSNDE